MSQKKLVAFFDYDKLQLFESERFLIDHGISRGEKALDVPALADTIVYREGNRYKGFILGLRSLASDCRADRRRL